MIMLSYKAQSMGFLGVADDGRSLNQGNMLAQLQKGLGVILDALSNYSLAYEGLSGMRGMLSPFSFSQVRGFLVRGLLTWVCAEKTRLNSRCSR